MGIIMDGPGTVDDELGCGQAMDVKLSLGSGKRETDCTIQRS